MKEIADAGASSKEDVNFLDYSTVGSTKIKLQDTYEECKHC